MARKDKKHDDEDHEGEAEVEGEVEGEGRSGWNPDLDEVVREIGSIREPKDAKTKINVSVRRYDGGAEKVAIQRIRTRKGEEVYGRLGRLTVAEAKALGKLLGKL